MSRHFRMLTAFAATLFALSAARIACAVDSVGGLGSAQETNVGGTNTFIDLLRGATGNGLYSEATVIWENGPAVPSSACQFMLKFYRPDAGGTSLQYLDERGPFDVARGVNNVTLTPPVPLLQGDVVGITELPGVCGGVRLATGAGNATLAFLGDNTDDVTLCDQPSTELIPQTIDVIVRATGTVVRAGVVLGAGSVQGAQGSNFKTSMQLVNPGDQTIEGDLVFHPVGHPASPNDPSMFYSIGPAQTLAFPDVVAAIGGNGLGSIDVMADSTYAPLVLTRIFNDGGAAGTAGFSEPMVRPGDEFVIDSGHSAWLVAPADLTQFRMNLAVRSLSEGANFTINVYKPDGTLIGSTVKSLPADEFDLGPVANFLGALVPPENGLVEMRVTGGRAIVAGISVDNVSNDTAVQFGTRNHF